MSLKQALRCSAATAALALAAGGAQAQSSDVQMMQQQIQQLQQQLQNLQSQVNAQMRAQQQQQATPAAVAVAPAAPAPHVTQTPGNRFGFESADGQYSIGLTGRLNFDAGDYLDFNQNSKATTPTNLASGINARRARLGITGKFAGDWNYSFIYDFGGSNDNGPGSPAAAASGGIENAYITYNGLNRGPLPLAFDLGYQDTPFTLEEAQSSNDIMFMERASVQTVASNIFANDFRSAAGVRSNDSRYWAGVYVTGPQSGELHTATGGGSQQFGAFGRFAYQVLQAPDYSLHFGVEPCGLLKPPATATAGVAAPVSTAPELRIDSDQRSWPRRSARRLRHQPSARGKVTAARSRASRPRAAGEISSSRARATIPCRSRWLAGQSFWGGYLEGSWTVTGEHRKYLQARAPIAASFRTIPSRCRPGLGRLELAAPRQLHRSQRQFHADGGKWRVAALRTASGRTPDHLRARRQLVRQSEHAADVHLSARPRQEGGTTAGAGSRTGANFDAVACAPRSISDLAPPPRSR